MVSSRPRREESGDDDPAALPHLPARSGARKNHPGLFGDPGYDDILLDEIGETSPAIQAKLLGVLGDSKFVPLGGTSTERQPVKARILMATNRDLADMVRIGSFRQDLF